MRQRIRQDEGRTRVLPPPIDPGPARPLTILWVAVLSGLFLAAGISMVRHNFLGNESDHYYSERVSTPWHFQAPLNPFR